MLTIMPRAAGVISAEQSLDLGLAPVEHAVLMCIDQDGSPWTLFGTDIDHLNFMAVVLLDPAQVGESFLLNVEKFPLMMRRWPAELEVGDPLTPSDPLDPDRGED